MMKTKTIFLILVICVSAECLSQQTIDVVVAINQPVDCPLSIDVEESIIYPNPAFDFIRLPLGVKSFHLVDASGREYNPKYDFQNQSISTSNLKEGIYFLQVITKDGSKVWKVKIERR